MAFLYSFIQRAVKYSFRLSTVILPPLFYASALLQPYFTVAVSEPVCSADTQELGEGAFV